MWLTRVNRASTVRQALGGCWAGLSAQTSPIAGKPGAMTWWENAVVRERPKNSRSEPSPRIAASNAAAISGHAAGPPLKPTRIAWRASAYVNRPLGEADGAGMGWRFSRAIRLSNRVVTEPWPASAQRPGPARWQSERKFLNP